MRESKTKIHLVKVHFEGSTILPIRAESVRQAFKGAENALLSGEVDAFKLKKIISRKIIDTNKEAI